MSRKPQITQPFEGPTRHHPIGLRWWLDASNTVRVGWPPAGFEADCNAFGWLHAHEARGTIEASELDPTTLSMILDDAFPGRRWLHPAVDAAPRAVGSPRKRSA